MTSGEWMQTDLGHVVKHRREPALPPSLALSLSPGSAVSLCGEHAIRHNEKGDVMLGPSVRPTLPLFWGEGCVAVTTVHTLYWSGTGSGKRWGSFTFKSRPSLWSARRSRVPSRPVECLWFPPRLRACHVSRTRDEEQSTCPSGGHQL